ncbi:helix-turn-helix domain-containing protein [Flavobacterium sp. HSC-61S13]|uniref:winged helix-turn-helix transcriptional regulator n=1 Tax=Flavobacterium sp. HSC-61S13 TaxID=2910963 RepID=UPI00209D321B|nr:helix-turn-helix domain-containing protein [Flavobacterium sp. HSC-61S13]MCP1995578.1 DNA-binding HxlR family transcriptional regulator [Flavobacterium sp. HSC-61S13]
MEKKSTEFSNTDQCPVRNVLDRFGDKWSMLIILLLGQQEVMRFNEMHKAIGDISQKMLTVSVRKLEADGLLSRQIFPVIPPRVEYQLTPLGKSLLPLMATISDWANQNMTEILENRSKFQ